jgi:hypothetical protein
MLAALLHRFPRMAARRTSGGGNIDDGAQRSHHPRYFDEDETLVDDPVPVNDFSELEDEGDENPSERRRDPLRRKF